MNKKKPQKTVMVSACLAGEFCRYDGESRPHPRILRLVRSGRALVVCPERLAGLPIPRPPCEIQGGDGNDVLAGRARVLDKTGRDITDRLIQGAVAAGENAGQVKLAVLKEKSAACGVDFIHCGTFTGVLRPGPGIFTALLRQKGIKVISETALSREDLRGPRLKAGEL